MTDPVVVYDDIPATMNSGQRSLHDDTPIAEPEPAPPEDKIDHPDTDE